MLAATPHLDPHMGVKALGAAYVAIAPHVHHVLLHGIDAERVQTQFQGGIECCFSCPWPAPCQDGAGSR